MILSILITISIITGIWFFIILIYKVFIKTYIEKYIYLKINKESIKKLTHGGFIGIGLILSIIFTCWMVLSLGGSIILHQLNANKYNEAIEISNFKKNNIIPKDFEEKCIKLNRTISIKDIDKNILKYYVYSSSFLDSSSQPENCLGVFPSTSQINQIVIVHHGIYGSRFNTYPFLYSLMKVKKLSQNTLFVIYDARGWNDGKKRGKPTFGIKEADDLFLVIKSLEKNYPEILKIITYGYSMGGGTIFNMLSKYQQQIESDNKLTKFIVDSGYYHLKEELIFYASKFFSKNFGKFIVDNAAWLYGLDNGINFSFNAFNVGKVNVDLMLLHSKVDKTVNYIFSCNMNKERNKNNLNNKTKTWLIPIRFNVGHIDIIKNKNTKDDFNRFINDFLNDDFRDIGVNNECE